MGGGRALVILLLAAGIAPAAAQTFPERAFRDARIKSEFHIQIAIERVKVPTPTPGICTVYGKIERVFRGPTTKGTPIELDLECKRKTDVVKPGSAIWIDSDQLVEAKHMEAFVNRGPYGFAHALWQHAIIAEPTEQPTIKP
ncbi:MAG: hypothetical protein IT561_10870 [Alphaproteobacteria bacterium]|nr:hypothetical protein [Alphaproteobacteria bacterium]